VAVTLSRAVKAGLDWPATQALPDDALEQRVYGVRTSPLVRSMPDFEYLHA
jgi:hypothetical protein